MNIARILLAAASLAVLAGCGDVAFTPQGQGDPSRTLNGEISLPDVTLLPPDAIMTVRVVDATAMPPAVLGSQTLANPGSTPVAFRVEYQADDELLLRGLNIEVRVSVGGKVRYYNRNKYAVHLSNAGDTHRITLDRSSP